MAQIVCKDPDSAIRSSIASLAQAAMVSEPTVNRFCRSLGCSGFPDFKLQLAQSLANGVPYVSRVVEPSDTVDDYTTKIFKASMAALSESLSSIDTLAIGRAVDLLSQARKIEFYGLGASGSVAVDAQHKFFRLNVPVVAHVDTMMQRMSAATMQQGDVSVIISKTGRTISLIEVARLAREAGGTVIAITTPDSPLAEQSSLTLGVHSNEDTDMYTPSTSRIVHLAVIDSLATGVTLRRGADFQVHLKRVKDSLIESRVSLH